MQPPDDRGTGDGVAQVTQARATTPRRAGRARSALPLAVAAVVGLVLIATLNAFVDDTGASGPACTALTVVSSSNKAELLEEMAGAYEDTEPTAAGTCVDVRIVSTSSGAAADALSQGWDEVTDGPRPHVWSPASSAWLDILSHRLAERAAEQVVKDPPGFVAKSPQVIAMPRPMARELGWPERPIGWQEVFELATDPKGWAHHGHPEWGRFRLGKTDITQSTSALNATIVSYMAATGTSGELTGEHLNDPQVVEFVRAIESAVEHYGDTSLTFLENLRRADERGETLNYLSAVILEEKSVWDYNRGNPSGDPEELGERAPPKVPLVAVYPKEGTLMADHPYAVLDLPWVDDRRREAAAGFLAFLQQPPQQRRFQAAGFRDHQGVPGPEVKPDNGLLPGPLVERPLPEPHVLVALQDAWRGVRKRARVLVVLDVSGSMANPVRSTGTTKLELAKQALRASFPHLENDDEVGLWVFSPPAPDGSAYTEVVPLSPYGTRAAELKDALGAITADRGGSRLYATLEAALARLRDGVGQDRITGVILISDGPNEDGVVTEVEPLLAKLEDASRSGIQVYPVAYGERADRSALQRVAEASRTRLYEVSDPRQVETVLPAVLSNFSSL